MPIDARIPLMVQPPQINSPMQNRLSQLALQDRQLRVQDRQQQMQSRNALSDLLRSPGAFGADGTLNPEILPQVAQVAPEQAFRMSGAIQNQRATQADAARKGLDWIMQGLDVANTPQAAIQYVNDSVSNGFLPQASARQILSQIPTDPAAYNAWREQTRGSMMTEYQKRGLELARDRLEASKYSAPQQSTEGYFRMGPNGPEFLTDKSTGNRIMPISASPETRYETSKASARGTAEGKRTAEDAANAPQDIAALDTMLNLIDTVANHIGLDQAVGTYIGNVPPVTPDAIVV